MKGRRIGRLAFLLALALALVFKGGHLGYAMEAPGDGDPGWYYRQENHHWCYRQEDQSLYTGWLEYHGEWYWFNGDGWMADGGLRTVDGLPYYFFINGHIDRKSVV